MDSYDSVQGLWQPPLKRSISKMQLAKSVKSEPVSPDHSHQKDVKPSSASSPSELSTLTEMLAQGLQAAHYKKLKPFSGIVPVIIGEETFARWKEQALQCLKEWSCSEETKRQRITESLRSSAAEILRLHRDINPNASAADYVQALSDHYEPYYDPVQMLFEFRMSRQHEGESISEFITRLQLSLSRLVYYQAATVDEVDSWRNGQLMRGLAPNHPLTAIIKMTLGNQNMSIHDLMKVVKKHEADLIFSTERGSGSGTKVSAPNPPALRRTAPSPDYSSSNPVRSPSGRGIRNCSKCGSLGHAAANCRDTIESSVQKVTCSVPRSPRVSSKRKLEKSFVGPKSTINILIEGYAATALFDTGSQVTIIYQSFYERFLSHLPLQPLDEIELWGLNAESYPVEGSLQILIEIPELEKRGVSSMEITALICPDPGESHAVPVILGTNCTTVYSAFQSFLDGRPHDGVSTNSEGKDIQELCHVLSIAYKHGIVYHIGKDSVEIPPGGERVVHIASSMPAELLGPGSYVLMETPDDMSAKNGWMVIPERKDWRTGPPSSAVLTVRNRSPHVVAIKPFQDLAYCYPVDGVNPYAEAFRIEVKDPLPELKMGLTGSPLSPAWITRVTRKLSDVSEVFSTDDLDVGCARSAQHSFHLTDSTPFRERSRRIPPKDVPELRRTLTQMKDQGIIVDSRSPYASPIVIVRKKSGDIRLCVDYRTLNRRTIPDQYTLPRIEEALEALNGNRWFSVLDLKSGYYQVPMASEDQEKTAFICPLGFYQFTRMPQGIMNAPATFQRLMERVLGDLVPRECLVYLDDIIVFGATLEEHEERLLRVLCRLREEGLKLSSAKCKFFQSSVTYVGHIISPEGVSTDPVKVEAVVNWPVPRNVTELRSFLGFCGYYRRFVEGYSRLARPLHLLLQKDPNGEKNYRVSSKTSFDAKWTSDCEQSFEQLKRRLTQAPVLAYADARKPYVLHVDASFEGLGGALHQEYPTGLRPIAFISRSLTPSERNYPVHKLEFLALKWAVVDKLHDYLYGAVFEVRTDNNPLTYLQSTAKLDATGHRWMAALGSYNFSTKYKAGKKNVGADALSRRPGLPSVEDTDEEWVEIPGPGVRAICATAAVSQNNVAFSEMRVVDCLGGGPEAVPKMYSYPTAVNPISDCYVMPKKMIAQQKMDPVIGPLYRAVLTKDSSTLKKTVPKESCQFLRDWDKFVLIHGLLYRKILYHDHPGRCQLVLPNCFRRMVCRSLHDRHGHLGVEKTYGLIQDRFFWPNMRDTVTQWCRQCLRCLQRKTLPVRAAPMAHLQSTGPMDLVCMDFVCIEPDSQGKGNVLVVTDHFTRYAQAFPTKNQTAATVAKVLWEKYFVHYGLPHRLHSDQGRDFESRLIKELLQLLNITKSRTTPYHPEGDALPERFNRTLLNMLGTLSAADKRSWSCQIESLVHAYNSTRHESTGFSPYFLMFGREPRLPIDLFLGVSTDGVSHRNHYQYVARLKESLKAAYTLAEENTAKVNSQNKRRYDQRIRSGELAIGDQVLLRNLGIRGKHKLADRWRKEVFTIVDKLTDLPVYKIKGPEGRIKAWHRNHLLPLPQMLDNHVSVDLLSSATPLGSELKSSSLPNELSLPDTEEPLGTVESEWSIVPDAGSSVPPVTASNEGPISSQNIGSVEDSDLGAQSNLLVSSSIESEPVQSLVNLQQRDVRRGDRIRRAAPMLTYNRLGHPTLVTPSQVVSVKVGMVSVFRMT